MIHGATTFVKRLLRANICTWGNKWYELKKNREGGEGEGEIRDHVTKRSLKYSVWFVRHDCRYSDISKEINCSQCFVSSGTIFVN